MEFVIVYLIGSLIGLAILFSVIRAAVEHALEQHFKVVRRFEETGEWFGRSKAPKVTS